MMMPPPFVPVRTSEESRSPRAVPPENADSPKPKMPKPAAVTGKAKSPTESIPVVSAVAHNDKVPIGQKSIVIQQPQSLKPAVVNVIRPQSAGLPAAPHNGFAKVETQRVVSTNSNSILLDRKHVITNPKLETERLQSSYNG